MLQKAVVTWSIVFFMKQVNELRDAKIASPRCEISSICARAFWLSSHGCQRVALPNEALCWQYDAQYRFLCIET